MSETEEYHQALKAATHFMKIRPRSRGEVADLLTRKGFSQEVQAQILDRLEQLGLLDDKRFVEMWLYHRTEVVPRGGFIIKHELRQRKVAEDLIETLVEPRLAEAEPPAAHRLAAKKWRSLPSTSQRYAKVGNYLKSKGFSASTIHQVLQELSR